MEVEKREISDGKGVGEKILQMYKNFDATAIVNQIMKESKQRDKIRDTSVIDKMQEESPYHKKEEFDEKEKKELANLISNWSNKNDLASQFLELIPLYFDEAKLWWRWHEGNKKWKIIDETTVLNLVEGCSNCNVINSKEKTEILNALRVHSRRTNPKTPKNTWIQFKEEIIDILTGDRFEATSKFFFTNPIPYRLGRINETPVMDRIFEEWVSKEYVQTLYEIIAYCLLADYPIHRLFCFIGSGLNGKSSYLELLQRFIGNENCCSTELDVLMMSRFEVTRLHKKLVCQMGETNFNEMSRTSMLKKLTGGDLIGFEYKGKDHINEKNYAKILISTNSLPVTNDKTIGFYRRWMIIDFPNRFSEKTDILSQIPEEEYENLAMKSVEILFQLLQKREFHKEGTVEERMAKFEAKSDFLQKFLDDFTEEDNSGFLTKKDFTTKFKDWCKENRHREMADNTLGKKMKEKGFHGGRKYAEWMFDGKGGQLNVFLGIKWKD